MISIVMLTHNRPKLLRQALVTLYATTPEDEFSLVIVDDSTTSAEALDIMDGFILTRNNISTLRILGSNHVLAHLKNLGVAWSQSRFGRGDYLLLCDNDVAFLPGWWQRMPRVFNAKAPAAPLLIGGQRHPYHQSNNNRMDVWDETDAVAGTSQLMPWWVWDAYGPLEGNAPGTCQSEDFAFSQKIRNDGGYAGYMHEPAILDCGITQTNGQPSPGADVKPRMEGYLYL